MRKLTLYIIAILFLLSACSGAAVDMPEQTAEPTQAATATQQLQTDAPTPAQQTQTPTPTPIVTSAPQPTPIPDRKSVV